jgi:hypothetical protein
MKSFEFIFNDRLQIPLPELHLKWDQISAKERAEMLKQWEEIRGRIPDQIKAFEAIINMKQDQLNKEENFINSCHLNTQISEIASKINDLHLWYRLNQEISMDKSHP